MLDKINKKERINIQISKAKFKLFKNFHLESFWGFQQTHKKFKLTKTLRKPFKLIKLIQNKKRKQPLRGVLEYICFEVCGQNSWKIPMRKFIVNKVEGIEPATFRDELKEVKNLLKRTWKKEL